MLTMFALLYFKLSQFWIYMKSDNYNKDEYMNRRSTKRKIIYVILAVILDTVLFGILIRIGLSQLDIFNTNSGLDPWRYR